MATFSERMGITKSVLQTNEMSKGLRNVLWSVVYAASEAGLLRPAEVNFTLAFRLFKEPADTIQLDLGWIRYRYFKLEWFKVYDFFECLLAQEMTEEDRKQFEDMLNRALETGSAGFRVVNSLFVPILDSVERDCVDEALAATESSGFGGAREHLRKALEFLSKKPDPDYRNSIRESISAVESACRIMSGDEKADLSKALAKLNLHPALKSGFEKIYGWTNDEHGIRHSLLEDECNAQLVEAKFMAVACSAFVNFLITKKQELNRE